MSATAESTTPALADPARRVNFLTGLLGIAGVFVAGVLSVADTLQKSVPCGASTGCAQVAESDQSHWGAVPVAYVGLLGYALLTLLSVGRAAMGKKNWKPLTRLSLIGTTLGFFVSCYFMYASLVDIGATCQWCITSAVIMTLSLIATFWLWYLPEPESHWGKAESMVYAGGLILALGGVGAVSAAMPTAGVRELDESATLTKMLPDKAKVKGPEGAPVTIIEFADFNCEACRNQSKFVSQVLKEAGDNVRFAYRSVPLVELKGHESSMHVATLSELAAEKGKFWEFYEAAFRVENGERLKTVEGAKQIAEEIGLTPAEIEAAVAEGSPQAKRVVADFDLAFSYNITATPTFAVFAKGATPKIVPGSKLESILGAEPYNSLLIGR